MSEHRKYKSPTRTGPEVDSVLVTAVTSQPNGVRIHYAEGTERTPEPTEDVPEPAPKFVRRGGVQHFLDDEAAFEAERPSEGTRWERDKAAAIARLKALGKLSGELEES